MNVLVERGGSQLCLEDQKAVISKKNEEKALENENQCIKAWQGAINSLVKHLYISPHGYSGPRSA